MRYGEKLAQTSTKDLVLLGALWIGAVIAPLVAWLVLR